MQEFLGDYNSSKLESCENGEFRITMRFYRGQETKIFMLDENGLLYTILGPHQKHVIHDAAVPGVRFQLEESMAERLAERSKPSAS